MIWHLVKCPAVKRHWQSKVRGQMSLTVKFFKSWLPIKNPRSNVTAVKCPGVKCPAVKCHLRSSFSNLGCRSKIPRSNVTAVKCPAVKRHWRSMVPRSNVTCGQVFLCLIHLLVQIFFDHVQIYLTVFNIFWMCLNIFDHAQICEFIR